MVQLPSNIDTHGVTVRLRSGVYVFAVALAVIAALRFANAPSAWFGLVALPFAGAFMLIFQGLFKT